MKNTLAKTWLNPSESKWHSCEKKLRLRELDLNQRPPGYEPDELLGSSTPRTYHSEYCLARQTGGTTQAAKSVGAVRLAT